MTLREELKDRVSPSLGDERIESVFLAQTGPNPWRAVYPPVRWRMKHYVIAVTDRRIAIFRASRMSVAKPEWPEVASLPREALAEGLGKGWWGQLDLAGTKYWVGRYYRQDVEAARREMRL